MTSSRGVTKRVIMNCRSLGALAAMWLLAGAASAAGAQNKGTAQIPYLRLEWEFESARGAWQNACGRVFNDRDVAARHVMIMFEGFDSQGKKVSRRFGEVVGDVPPRGYAIFCLQVKSGGATYQASIPGVDWGGVGGQ
jgi:hypothetical protein